jgi:hypothetical protein
MQQHEQRLLFYSGALNLSEVRGTCFIHVGHCGKFGRQSGITQRYLTFNGVF